MEFCTKIFLEVGQIVGEHTTMKKVVRRQLLPKLGQTLSSDLRLASKSELNGVEELSVHVTLRVAMTIARTPCGVAPAKSDMVSRLRFEGGRLEGTAC